MESACLLQESDIPHAFLAEHKECCELFLDHQTNTILENLRLFENHSEELLQREQLKADAVEYFFKRFPLELIKQEL